MALRLPSQNKAFRPAKPKPRAPTVKPSGPSQSAASGPSQSDPKRTHVVSASAPASSSTTAAASQDEPTISQDAPGTQATQGPPGLTQGPTQSSQDTVIATPRGKDVRLPVIDDTQADGVDGDAGMGKDGEFAVPGPRTSAPLPALQTPSSPAQATQVLETASTSTQTPTQPAASPSLPSEPAVASSSSQAEAPAPAQPPNNGPLQPTPRKGTPSGRNIVKPAQRTRPPSTAPSNSSTSASKGPRLSLLSAAKQAANSGPSKPSPGRLPSRSRSTSVRAPSVPPGSGAAGPSSAPVQEMPVTSAATGPSTETPGPETEEQPTISAGSVEADKTAQEAAARASPPTPPNTVALAASVEPPAPETLPANPNPPANAETSRAVEEAVGATTDRGISSKSAVDDSTPATGPPADVSVDAVNSEPVDSAPNPRHPSDPAPATASPSTEPPLTLAAVADRSQSPARDTTRPADPLFLPDRSPSPIRDAAPAPTAAQPASTPSQAMTAAETAAAAQAILDKLVLQRNTGRPIARHEGRRLSPKARSSPGILTTKRTYMDKTVKSQQAARKEAEAAGMELPEHLQRKRKTRRESTQASDTASQDNQASAEVDELAGDAEQEAPPPKRKPGRPKKVVDPDEPPKEKRPRGRPRKTVEGQAGEAYQAPTQEKQPRGRKRKNGDAEGAEIRDETADGEDAPPKEKRPRGRPRKNVDEASKENDSEVGSAISKKDKVLPAFSQVSLVGFEPGDTIGDGIDVNLLTMADLATNIFSGQITAKGVQLDEMMQVEKTNRKIRGQHNAWNGWTRAQLSRRKVRREQNAEREKRRQVIRDEGRDPMGEVTEDEPDSDEEFEVTPNRYTPPPEDERTGRILPTVLGQQAPEYGANGTPAPGEEDEDGEDGDQRQRRRGPEGGEDGDEEEDEHRDEPEEEYGVELRVVDDEPENPHDALAEAGFAVAEDDLGGGGGGRGGEDGDDDDDDDYDYEAGEDDGYDLAQYHAEREAQRERELAERENRAVIEENDDLTMINSRTYAKATPRGIPWTEADMLTMYMALSEVGPNSDIVTGYFPGRTRKQVNRKMVKEQRANPDKFWAAVANKRDVDVEHLKISAAYDDHEDWTKEDEFLEQCRRDAEACRDDYVAPEEDQAANEEGLQQMAEENEKENHKEDEDDYEVAADGEGDGAGGYEGEDGELVAIEGYVPEGADEAQDKEDDDYDYEQ